MMRHPRTYFLGLLFSISAVLLATPRGSNTTPDRPHTYLGFDSNQYPGDDALPILHKTFSFSSYWLGPPPEEKSSTWLGKRGLLKSQGFGFVVLFNGRGSRKLKSIADARQKGTLDAENAAKLARQEGFPSGTIIYLDIEEGGRLPATYHEYVNSWIDALAQASFRSGAYCSAMPVDEGGGVTITTAKDLQDHLDGRKLIVWAYNDACPPAPGCVFPLAPPAVAQSGFLEAALWQYAQSPRRKQFTAKCAPTYAADGNCYAPGDSAHKWFLDANVANSPNPSAPGE
ncbi:MAG: glycoside hydrolase domain-containing protein [Candidatus Acidiferrum sp.]